MSKIQVKSVEKSSRWGKEDIRGNVRFFAVVRFTKADNKYSYPLSYDLAGIYGDDEQCQDESGKFDAEKAFEQFTKDARGEEILEELNLYEIALPFAVKVPNKVGARPFVIQCQAFYGTEKEAQEYVIRALNRDLANGRLVRVESEKDTTDRKKTKAILKGIEVLHHEEYMEKHHIKMLFVESPESDDVYTFRTSIEVQFCTKDEYDMIKGLPDKLLEEKLNYANTLIGKTFDINLYKFSVKELTNNKYTAIELTTNYFDDLCDYDTIEEYHIASYMTKEDVIWKQKYSITMKGINGDADGVTSDGTMEEITTELFFPQPIPEKKHLDIPYNKFPQLNASSIINVISIDEIRNGHHLANQMKDYNVPEYEFDKYIRLIEEYRSGVRATQIANESLRKKIFFWEPKETVEELKLPPNIIALAKDSIILSRLYPSDCKEAAKEYSIQCERNLRKQFMNEDTDAEDFKDKTFEFIKALKKKYEGKEKIKPID